MVLRGSGGVGLLGVFPGHSLSSTLGERPTDPNPKLRFSREDFYPFDGSRIAFSRTARPVTATVRDSKKEKATWETSLIGRRFAILPRRIAVSFPSAKRETHGGTPTVPEKLEISYRHLWAAQGVKRGLGTNKGTRGLRFERDNLGAQPPTVPPFARSRSWRRTDDDDVGDAAAGRAGARRAPCDAARAPASTRGRCPR